jgi:hypothetical protein
MLRFNHQQQPQYSDENAYPRDDSNHGAHACRKPLFDERANSHLRARTRILDNHGNGSYMLCGYRLFMAA